MEPTPSRTPALLIGAWELISFAIQKADGDVIYPFGENVQGTIIYTESGRVSGQMMQRGRPLFASGDQMKGTTEEIEANFKGCISYYGSYKFDINNDTVIHDVEGSLFPNWEKTSQKRFIKLSGNRLTLSTPPTLWGGGGKVVAILIFDRIT